MLSRDEAKQLVKRHLDREVMEIDCGVEIIDAATFERAFGWVFFYQSQEYLRTGNRSSQLAGNAPLIINRHTGEIVPTGTAEPLKEYVTRYEASLA